MTSVNSPNQKPQVGSQQQGFTQDAFQQTQDQAGQGQAQGATAGAAGTAGQNQGFAFTPGVAVPQTETWSNVPGNLDIP